MKKARGKFKPPHLSRKVALYFDENFPREIIDRLKSNRGWKSKYRFYSVYDLGNENKDDTFQLQFCKKKGYTLVTLDDDFLDDKSYPFNGFPGIVRIVAGKNDLDTISYCIEVFLSFLILIPYPKVFLTDAKFRFSPEGGVMRGRDFLTGEIKTYPIVPRETTIGDIMKFFHCY